MWHECLQAVCSTLTDRRVRKHARRTWSVSAATRSRLKMQTGDQDEIIVCFVSVVVFCACVIGMENVK